MGQVRLLDDALVYKASEAARLLNLNIQTVHKLIKRGELLALDLRVAGSPKATWRITRASLEMYLAQARHEAEPRTAVAGVR